MEDKITAEVKQKKLETQKGLNKEKDFQKTLKRNESKKSKRK